MDCAAPAGTAPAGTDARPSRAAPAGTAPAGTGARLSLGEIAEMALYLNEGGASKVEISNYDHGGIHFIAVFTAGLPASAASGWRGGQRPRGTQAENWRRRDPAADPGPKMKPRRRKANVQSSTQCPGWRGGQRPRGAQAEIWRRRDPAADPGPKMKPRRRKANVQSSTQCPPAAEPVALPPRQQECGSNSERKRRSRSETRSARQHLKMAEVAAKTQVAGAPEAPAPTAVGELGAGSHAPPPAPAATATTPAAPS